MRHQFRQSNQPAKTKPPARRRSSKLRLPKPSQLSRRQLLFLATGLVLIGTGLAWLKLFLDAQITRQFYFVDSKYQGIKSQFDHKKSAKFNSIVEYPLTNIKAVDELIQQQLRPLTDGFIELAQKTPASVELASQKVSYQVYLNDAKFLSLAIFVHQDMRSAHPSSQTLFWTFDKTTGKPITISQLFNNQRPAIDHFLNTLKQAIRDQTKHAKTDLSDDYFQQTIGNGDQLNFIIKDKQTIEFLFGRGTVGPQSAGDIGVVVKVNNFKNGLQNPLAKALFDIQAVAPNAPPPKRTDQVLALTYDDGPGAHTARLLDILRDQQVPATFYVIGQQVPGHAELIKRMVREKHELGNHTWNHPNLNKLPATQIEQQIADTANAIKAAEPQAVVRTLRPPYGAYSQTVSNIAAKYGLSNVIWSVDTRDWADRKADVVCNRAITSARPGAIILLHDIHGSSVDATPCIIDGLKKAGYKFVTVSDLFSGQLKPGVTYFQN